MFQKYLTGNKALDFGCGCGYSALFLKSQNLDVKGVDINPSMIDKAKIIDPEGIYFHIQEGILPFADAEFDLVFSAFVLVEIDTREKLQKSLNEIARVLKKGGNLLLFSPAIIFANMNGLR